MTGPLAPLLAVLACSLAIATASLRTQAICLAILVGAAVATASLGVPADLAMPAAIGCWGATAASAMVACIGRSWRRVAIATTLHCAIWIGLLTSADPRIALFRSFLGLLALPVAAGFVRCGAGIALRVAASWLLATALLCTTLPFLPVTPGYLPDHLE